MAIAFDAATSAQATSASSIGLSHTASGSDRAVFAGVCSEAVSPDATSTVTYGGTSMTEQWDRVVAFAHSSGHTLVAPATGAQTVTATLAGSDDMLTLGVISLTGVDQSTPVGTAASADGDSATASVTVTSATGELVVDNVCAYRATITVGAGQTQRWQQNVSSVWSGGGSTEAGAASVAMTWTFTAEVWAIGAIPFKPAAGESTPFPPWPQRVYQLRN
jgi:large repetitive protein